MSDVLLVAASGGIDSMVLTQLLLECGYNIQLAHVNFGLRGRESDEDEQFLSHYAQEQKLTIHLKRAEQADFSRNKSGIQQSARNIRYQWFDKLIIETKSDYLLLAHHQDDQSETILHQFLRGGMLAALRGMRLKSNRYVRPLLNFSKEEIESYAKKNNLAWRSDSSNQTLKYTRNFIRHEVMPVLQKVNPDVKESLASRAAVFAEIESLVADTIQQDINSRVMLQENKQAVSVEWLRSYRHQNLFVWQWLEVYGFTSSQMQDVLSLLEAQSGSYVDGTTHVILRNRNDLVVSEINPSHNLDEVIERLPFQSSGLILEEVKPSDVHFENKLIHYIDLDKIEFPLRIRTWKAGDKINPLGMQGTQKVSDVLIQQKVSLTDKADVLVVLDATKKIVSIPGFRISDSVKVTDKTKHVLMLELRAKM